MSTDPWENAGKRTAADLYDEILAGESILYTDDEGRLFKYGRTIKMDVFFSDESGQHTGEAGLYRLFEAERHDSLTGEPKKRRKLRYTLGEKLQGLDEEPGIAAMRALGEELGIDEPLGLWYAGNQVWPPTDDFDYPGLQAVSHGYYYAAQLRPEDYKDRYVEAGKKVTTTFTWERVRPSLVTDGLPLRH